jgi:hypothetical protein
MTQQYSLTITCPLCNTVGTRKSNAPFIYLDEQGIQEHAQHTAECLGNAPTSPIAYTVVREPDEIRRYPGDPLSPEEEVV